MTELGNTSAFSTAMGTQTTDAGITTDAGGRAIRWIRWLVVINLGLVTLQPLSAGFFLSGYGGAATAHAAVAIALQVGALLQAITAIVLWRLRRVPAWVAGVSVGLLVMVFLQVGLGYRKQFWLHVPLGVGLVGLLTRQLNWLDTLSRVTGSRS